MKKILGLENICRNIAELSVVYLVEHFLVIDKCPSYLYLVCGLLESDLWMKSEDQMGEKDHSPHTSVKKFNSMLLTLIKVIFVTRANREKYNKKVNCIIIYTMELWSVWQAVIHIYHVSTVCIGWSFNKNYWGVLAMIGGTDGWGLVIPNTDLLVNWPLNIKEILWGWICSKSFKTWRRKDRPQFSS